MLKTSRINETSLAELEQFITSDSNPKFFFTMTEINKIGLNPQSNYNTPLGIYAYPLTKEYYERLLNNTLPFAGDKSYINVFTLKDSTFNLSNYSQSDLKKDLAKIRFIYDLQDNDTKITEAITEAKSNSNMVASQFWNLTRVLSQNIKKWNGLLRQLGYTNFYDPGIGLIHSLEPTQIVVLDPTIIIPIESFINPNADSRNLNHVTDTDKNIIKQKNTQNEKKFKNKNPKVLQNLAELNIDSIPALKEILDNESTTENTIKYIIENASKEVLSDLQYYIVFHINTTPSIVLELLNKSQFPIHAVKRILNDFLNSHDEKPEAIHIFAVEYIKSKEILETLLKYPMSKETIELLIDKAPQEVVALLKDKFQSENKLTINEIAKTAKLYNNLAKLRLSILLKRYTNS